MDIIIGNRNIWQLVLAFATDGAFILDVPRSDGLVLTHTLAALRRTCKAMRDMIPAPTSINPYDMFVLGANIGNLILCEFAYPKISRFIKTHWKCKTDAKVHKKMLRMLTFVLNRAARDGHLNIVKFVLNTPFRSDFELYRCTKNAAASGHWDICSTLVNINSHLDDIVMEEAGLQNRADIIAKLKQCKNSYHYAFTGASLAGHVDLCEAMLNSGDITLDDALHGFRYGKTMNVDVLALHRKYSKPIGYLHVEFYNHTMLLCTERDDEQVLRMLRAWAIEDGIRPWYRILLHHMDDIVWSGTHISARMFQLIREFGRE